MAQPFLTDNQRLCLAPARNMLVSAGAGSGKTFLLVRKIVDLLSTGSGTPGQIGIENILALTFTRKAAGEMRTRVYSELLDRIESCNNSDLERQLLSIKEKIHAGKISTIHAFAAAVIRNHPVVAGVDPDFEVLDQATESVLVRDVVRSMLHDRWFTKDDKLKRILDLWEPYHIRTALEGLLRKPIELKEIFHGHNKTAILELLQRIQTDRWSMFGEQAREEAGCLWRIEKLADRCNQELTKRAKSSADKTKQEKAARVLDDFLEPLRAYIDSLSVGEADPKILDDFRAKAAEIKPPQWRPTPKQIIDALEEAVIPWLQPLNRDVQALDWIDDFVDLAREASARWQARKRREAVLCHDDLLLTAQDLCKAHPELVRGSIRHILVDEFQDTDPIQWDTILMLAHDRRNLPKNLFLVGDAKQAIYGFRGADHTITATAGEVLKKADPGSITERTLDENFRALSAPLNFTNALFERLFGKAEGKLDPYAVPPQKLKSVRAERGEEDYSSVSFLVSELDDESDPWAVEAEATVRFLQRICNGDEPDFKRITDLINAGKPAVGILFRSYAPMTHYIGELIRCGLSFSVYHGRTFYDTPEVQSLISLLTWISDPMDDAALVGLLRSPLLGWTDDELALICRDPSNRGEPLIQRLQRTGEKLDNSLSDLAGRTWGILERLRRLSDHLSLSETVREALDETLAPFTFSRGVRGPQAGANVEKFISLVRAKEASESSSAQTIVRAILQESEAGPGEAEAESPAEDRGSIQLMTIHAAKGLEFPLVIPACAGKGGRGNTDLFSKRIAFADQENPESLTRWTLCGIDFPDYDTDSPPTPTLLKSVLKEHDSLQSEEEEKRLLYVALTRAKDYLALPWLVQGDKIVARSHSHAWFMLQAVPEIEEAILHDHPEISFDSAAVKIREESGLHEQELVAGPLVDYQAREICSAEFPTPVPLDHVGRMPYPRRFRVSVTELMTFAKCPRRFYFERFFPGTALMTGDTTAKRPKEPPSPAAFDKSGELATIVGSLFHRIVEEFEHSIATWKKGAPVPKDVMHALENLASIAAEGTEWKEKRLLSNCLTHLRNLADSGILQSDPEDQDRDRPTILREIPFELEKNEFIIVGVLDRLQKAPDATWSLWDYKTSRLAGRAKEEIVGEEAYDVQLRIYAWAANRILDRSVSRAAIVFTEIPDDPLYWISVEPETLEQFLCSSLAKMSEVIDMSVHAFPAIRSARTCELCQCPRVGLCYSETC